MSKSGYERLVWYRIHWGRPVSFEQVESLLELLASSISCDIVLELHSSHDEVIFLIATYPDCAQEMLRIFGSVLQETILEDLSVRDVRDIRCSPQISHSMQVGHASAGLKVGFAGLISHAILSAIHSVQQGEALVLQVLLRRSVLPPYDVPKRMIDPRVGRLEKILHGPSTMPDALRKSLEHRYSRHQFMVEVRIGGMAAEELHGGVLLERIKGGMRLLEAHGATVDFIGGNIKDELYSVILPGEWRHLLSSTEVACILGVPYGDEEYSGAVSISPRVLRTPHDMLPESRSFAVSNDPANRMPIGISKQDSLRHTLLVGPTGMGKSTVMLTMILNDIQDGLGVIVIDPKGDLITAVLERMDIKRADDVVYIDPTVEGGVSVNPLAEDADPDLVADAMLAVLRDMFTSSWGHRMEDVLASALMTLTRAADQPTIVALPRLFYDDAFRRSLVDKAARDDPHGLGLFWKKYNDMTVAKQDELVAPIMSKLRTILTRKPLIRTLAQQDSNFRMKELFTKHKIVLVTLNKSEIGSTSARFLGSVILSQVWSLTQAQASIPESRRPIVKVYVDEMQDYLSLPLDIADALSQARGYHVGFTLAHQYRDQVRNRELLAGIDANVAHKVFFSLNDPDAKTIASMSDCLCADDFKKLPQYHIYMQTYHQGARIWLSARTLPPQRVVNDVDLFKRYSTQKYGSSR